MTMMSNDAIFEKEIEGLKGKKVTRCLAFKVDDDETLDFEPGLGLTIHDCLWMWEVLTRFTFSRVLIEMRDDIENPEKVLEDELHDCMKSILDNFSEWGKEYTNEGMLAKMYQESVDLGGDGKDEIKCLALPIGEPIPEWLPDEVKEAIKKLQLENETKGGELH